MDDIVRVACMAGHVYELGREGYEFTPEPELIAAMSVCKEMVAKPELSGLILECGEVVLWVRHPKGDRSRPARRLRLKKERQLDLFDDRPLDK